MGNAKTWWAALILGLVVMNFWTWSSLSQARAREKLTRETFAIYGGVNGYPPVRGGGSSEVVPVDAAKERDRLTIVATEAVKIFWDGVAERQEEKWRKDLEDEVRSLKEVVKRLEETMTGTTIPSS